jgi:hypothetical protein
LDSRIAGGSGRLTNDFGHGINYHSPGIPMMKHLKLLMAIVTAFLSPVLARAQYTYSANPGGNCSFPLLPVAPLVTVNAKDQKLYPACYVTKSNGGWPTGMLYANEIGIWDIASEDLGIYSWITPSLGFSLHISDFGKPYANGFGAIGWDDGTHTGREQAVISFGYPGVFRFGQLRTGELGDASGEIDAAVHKVGNCEIHSGAGDPNGAVYAPVCSMYLRSDGTPGHTLYLKETDGGSAMGWVPK